MFNIANWKDPVALLPGKPGNGFIVKGGSGVQDNEWGKYGRSYWFSTNDWSDSKIDLSAHEAGLYFEFLGQLYSINEYKTRGDIESERSKSRIITILCPVDVIVYDSNRKPIASVIDNTPNYYNSEFGSVIIITSGDEKVICLTENGEFTVHLTATDNGEMTYQVMETNLYGQSEDDKLISFTNVQLNSGIKMESLVTESIQELVQLKILDEDGNTVDIIPPDNNDRGTGDVNSDGSVDVSDAAILLQFLSDPESIVDSAATIDTKNADTNRDGSIDYLDAALILQYCAGISAI